jgi:hypothetical protein
MLQFGSKSWSELGSLQADIACLALCALGSKPKPIDVERVLRSELSRAFGSTENLLSEMKVNLVFKGVTYESLNDPEFISAMEKAVPFAVDPLLEE